MTSAATRTTIRFTILPLRHAGFVRMLTLGLFDSRTICPDSQIWLFSHFDRFCPDCTRLLGPKSTIFVRIGTKPFLLLPGVLTQCTPSAPGESEVQIIIERCYQIDSNLMRKVNADDMPSQGNHRTCFVLNGSEGRDRGSDTSCVET
jgi:hypothetical protein